MRIGEGEVRIRASTLMSRRAIALRRQEPEHYRHVQHRRFDMAPTTADRHSSTITKMSHVSGVEAIGSGTPCASGDLLDCRGGGEREPDHWHTIITYPCGGAPGRRGGHQNERDEEAADQRSSPSPSRRARPREPSYDGAAEVKIVSAHQPDSVPAHAATTTPG